MLRKALLFIEFCLAFFVPTLVLGLGFVYGLMLLVVSLGQQHYVFFGVVLFMLWGGVVGLWSAIKLLFRVLDTSVILRRPGRQLVFLVCGITSVTIAAIYLFTGGSPPYFLTGAMLLPIPVTLHLVYLNRDFLFQTNNAGLPADNRACSDPDQRDLTR